MSDAFKEEIKWRCVHMWRTTDRTLFVWLPDCEPYGEMMEKWTSPSFSQGKKEKNKILLCLGSLACDRRVSEVRCYSPYVKGKEIEIPRTWDSWHTFLLNACGLPGAVLELLGDTDGMMANKK